MKVAIIPARGGSRRIPLKNIRQFHGQPIIAYSIYTALQSRLFDAVLVSTDDQAIAAVARHYGATTLKRPPQLALDEVGTQEVIGRAIEQAALDLGDIDYACCIYPTAPMLTTLDLLRGWHALQRTSAMYAFAVGEEPFGPAGMFYWGRSIAFKTGMPLYHEHSVIIPIPPERCIDINTEEDWMKAEAMYSAWKGPE